MKTTKIFNSISRVGMVSLFLSVPALAQPTGAMLTGHQLLPSYRRANMRVARRNFASLISTWLALNHLSVERKPKPALALR